MLTVSTCMLVMGSYNHIYIIDRHQAVTTHINAAPKSQYVINLLFYYSFNSCVFLLCSHLYEWRPIVTIYIFKK